MSIAYLIISLAKRITGTQPCLVLNKATKQCIGACLKVSPRLFIDAKGVFTQISEKYEEGTCEVLSYADLTTFKRALTKYGVDYKDTAKQQQTDELLERQAPACVCNYWGETIGIAVLGKAKQKGYLTVAFLNKHNGRLGEPCVMAVNDLSTAYRRQTGYVRSI